MARTEPGVASILLPFRIHRSNSSLLDFRSGHHQRDLREKKSHQVTVGKAYVPAGWVQQVCTVEISRTHADVHRIIPRCARAREAQESRLTGLMPQRASP